MDESKSKPDAIESTRKTSAVASPPATKAPQAKPETSRPAVSTLNDQVVIRIGDRRIEITPTAAAEHAAAIKAAAARCGR